MSEKQLHACPFCGGKAETRLNQYTGDHTMAVCVSCGASAFYLKWNKRVSDVRATERALSPIDLVDRLRFDALRTEVQFSKGVAQNIEEAANEIEQLSAQHARSSERIADAVRSKEHCQYWYAVRLERIKDSAKAHGIWPEIAAIIANGTASALEPPTYAQQLNRAIHRAEASEAKLGEAVDLIEDLLGLASGSGEAGLAFVERYRASVSGSTEGGNG